METHSGDSPINRFCSFWGAILSFVIFGIVVLVMVGLSNSLSSDETIDSIDDDRRTELDNKSMADQQAAVTAWGENDDGSYTVPVSVALPLMAGKMAKEFKSGTPAAEAAARAAAEAAKAAQAAAQSTSAEPTESQ